MSATELSLLLLIGMNSRDLCKSTSLSTKLGKSLSGESLIESATDDFRISKLLLGPIELDIAKSSASFDSNFCGSNSDAKETLLFLAESLKSLAGNVCVLFMEVWIFPGRSLLLEFSPEALFLPASV